MSLLSMLYYFQMSLQSSSPMSLDSMLSDMEASPASTALLPADIKCKSSLSFTPSDLSVETRGRDSNDRLSTKPLELDSQLGDTSPNSEEEKENLDHLLEQSSSPSKREDLEISVGKNKTESKQDCRNDSFVDATVTSAENGKEDIVNDFDLKFKVYEDIEVYTELQESDKENQCRPLNENVSQLCNTPSNTTLKYVLPPNIFKNQLNMGSPLNLSLRAASADEAFSSGFESPVHNASHGCSPHPTPRPLKTFSIGKIKAESECSTLKDSPHKDHTYSLRKRSTIVPEGSDVNSENIIRLGHVETADVACSPIASDNRVNQNPNNLPCVTPIRISNELNQEQMDLKRTVETGTSMSPPKLNDIAVGGCGVSLVETGTCYTPIYKKDAGVNMSPVKMKDGMTEMPVLLHSEAKVGTTPKRTYETETETEHVLMSTTGTCYTPIQTVNSACGNDEIFTASKNLGTTPIQHKQISTMVTPVRMVDTASCNSPLATAETACNTQVINTQDSGVGTESVATAECPTSMTPVKMQDSSNGTEAVTTVESETIVTPVKLSETGTAMTPLQYRQNNLYSMVSDLNYCLCLCI